MVKAPRKLVSIVPPKPKAVRSELKVLDAYVDQIRLSSSAPAKSDSIRFEHTEVKVSPWAARAIQRFFNSPTTTRGEVEDLITQGVAVIAKCQTDLANGAGSTKNQRQVYALQAEMMLDVAVGTVVVHEMQTKGHSLLAAGSNEQVKELNEFQHRVRNVVQDLRRSLDESERRRANEFASAFMEQIDGPFSEAEAPFPTAPVEVGADAESPAPQTAPGPRPATTGRRSRLASAVFKIDQTKPAPSRGYLIPLVVFAMLAVLGIYGLSSKEKAPIRGDASESLTAALSGAPEITEVQDRMPYVILTVRESFWTSSSESEREDWIEDLSKPVSRHGYSGLVVHLTSGAPVAEWIRDRGVKFADQPER